MSTVKDNIWLTMKCRMCAEARYLRYSLRTRLLLTYISFLSLVVAIFSEKLRLAVSNFDAFAIFLSLSIFVVSLVSYSFRFSEKSAKHRECYLKLQKLDLQTEDAEKLHKKYTEILESYPNHSQHDWDDLVVQRTFCTKEKLKVGDKEITYTWAMLLRKVVRFSAFWVPTVAGLFYLTYNSIYLSVFS